MRFLAWGSIATLLWQLPVIRAAPVQDDLQGIRDLLKRQVPDIACKFDISLNDDGDDKKHHYKINQDCGSLDVHVEGNTPTAIISGVYRVLSEYGHGSISFTHSTLSNITSMPNLCQSGNNKVSGETVLPERYTFNTCTFGYTMPFFSFHDWEHMLDYMALGASVTMSLAWTGHEQIMIETLRDVGFSNDHIAGFLSAQPFLPWNRFGNIQGNFNGSFDFDMPRQQLELQKQILPRMKELGIKPIMPAFVGFVPHEITKVHPDANVTKSTQWNDFPYEYTNVTFLDPSDDLFGKIQKTYLSKQQKHFGNVTNLYTLDQFNELSPSSNDSQYLSNAMSNAVSSLKAHDKNSVMVMQAWMFYYDDFWTEPGVKSYLSGADAGDLLILDLYSDNTPLYSKYDGYYGHKFIFSSLHDFGGNMGFEGSVQYLTQNLTRDRQKYDGMVGVGITPEGLEGNQMTYDILFAQSWSEKALDISKYVQKFITARYGPGDVPQQLVDAWEKLVKLVYCMDKSTGVDAVVKGIYELQPALGGIANKTGSHGTKIAYDQGSFEQIWKQFAQYVVQHSHLVQNPHIHNDLVDITRQYLSNQFLDQYGDLVTYFNHTPTADGVRQRGNKLLCTLDKLDEVLYTDPEFLLSKWIKTARAMASSREKADAMEFYARNMVTWWGPHGEISDYSSRAWAGLVGTYYRGRWERFIDHLAQSDRVNGGSTSNDDLDKSFSPKIEQFAFDWQHEKWGQKGETWGTKGDIIQLVRNLL